MKNNDQQSTGHYLFDMLTEILALQVRSRSMTFKVSFAAASGAIYVEMNKGMGKTNSYELSIGHSEDENRQELQKIKEAWIYYES